MYLVIRILTGTIMYSWATVPAIITLEETRISSLEMPAEKSTMAAIIHSSGTRQAAHISHREGMFTLAARQGRMQPTDSRMY